MGEARPKEVGFAIFLAQMEAGNAKHLVWKAILIRFIAYFFSSKSSEVPNIWAYILTKPRLSFIQN